MRAMLLITALLPTLACEPKEGAEEIGMKIIMVNPPSKICEWEANDSELQTGTLDLGSVASDGGGIGYARRYPIGVNWTHTVEPEGDDLDAFINLHHAEVRFHFEDAMAQPTEQTMGSLPSVYRVPTSGTSDDGSRSLFAVFDVLPSWVVKRLAMDKNIWQANSVDGYIQPDKDYYLPLEFRIVGKNSAGRTVHSNWYRWVINLCRGCRLRYTCSPPHICRSGLTSHAGAYSNLGDSCPTPDFLNVVPWCAAGGAQGNWEAVAVCASTNIGARSYE